MVINSPKIMTQDGDPLGLVLTKNANADWSRDPDPSISIVTTVALSVCSSVTANRKIASNQWYLDRMRRRAELCTDDRSWRSSRPTRRGKGIVRPFEEAFERHSIALGSWLRCRLIRLTMIDNSADMAQTPFAIDPNYGKNDEDDQNEGNQCPL